jgi:chloramphenicol 3-O phosphotransferase
VVAGPGIPDPVRRWQVAVHAETDYDLRLDMGLLSPEAALSQIVPRLDSDVSV